MVSIICVFNNRKILENYLLKSLKNQKGIDYELILIDNTKNVFKSASSALNYGGGKAKGDFLIFVHQDISFEKEDALKNFVEKLNMYPNSIVGIAGRLEEGVITKLKHGEKKIYAGNINNFDSKEVQTVDECLFSIPQKIFKKNNFNEKIINGWHLYSVEYCIRLKEKGIKTNVVNVEGIYHLSPGYSMNDEYYKILKKIIKQYDIAKIYTTMGIWPGNLFSLNFKIIKIKIKRFLKLKIIRHRIR
jgi:hypothetical protein